MAISFGGTGNIQLGKLNANPRTGQSMPTFGSAGQVAIPAGSLPKRGRRGGGGDPLARIPKPVLEQFHKLASPKLGFRTLETQAEVRAVDADTKEPLNARVQEGEIKLYNVRGQEVVDVLFQTQPTEEHPDGELYTADGVEPMEILDRVPVEGSSEELNKLYNAMQTFNKATGKQLRMLFDHNVYDDSGQRIVKTVKVIWRTA